MNSTESQSACQLALITSEETPIVRHTFVPSVDSIDTRTDDAVALESSTRTR